MGEPVWLQPFPDVLLDGLPDAAPGPQARYEMNESISLAFIASVQSLPPRQRVVLVLRDVEAMVRLLTDDAWLRMPPLPLQYQGRARVAGFMATVALRGGTRRYRLVPTRANRQPAYGCYGYDGNEPVGRARGLMVLTVTNDGISTVTQFLDNSLLPLFGLPRTLRD